MLLLLLLLLLRLWLLLPMLLLWPWGSVAAAPRVEFAMAVGDLRAVDDDVHQGGVEEEDGDRVGRCCR